MAFLLALCTDSWIDSRQQWKVKVLGEIFLKMNDTSSIFPENIKLIQSFGFELYYSYISPEKICKIPKNLSTRPNKVKSGHFSFDITNKNVVIISRICVDTDSDTSPLLPHSIQHNIKATKSESSCKLQPIGNTGYTKVKLGRREKTLLKCMINIQLYATKFRAVCIPHSSCYFWSLYA